MKVLQERLRVKPYSKNACEWTNINRKLFCFVWTLILFFMKTFSKRAIWVMILTNAFISIFIGVAHAEALNTMFPAVFNLTNITGSNGFAMKCIRQEDLCGFFVSAAGDVNHDGIADILIGAQYGGQNNAGQVYLVFGDKHPWPREIDLGSLNGRAGVIFNGINKGDNCGVSGSGAGDVNGDGIDDIIIGAFKARNQAGQSYVVFGNKGPWSAVIQLASLNGRNGFIINGIKSGDNSGYSVSKAGDVNGDNIDDILIGAYGANNFQGQSYVIFGSHYPWPPTIYLSDINGYNGCTMNGIPGDGSGHAVSGAGDINGDGIDDIVIGPYNVVNTIGHTCVVFGTKKWPLQVNFTDLNGNNGFAINSISVRDFSGYSVSGAGDVNGDGIADILIGGQYAHDNIGQSYVVFGNPLVWPATIDLLLLNGNNGFAMDGVYDNTGWSVSGAGDVNGDGIDDMVIGAIYAGYVLFGSQQSWPALIYLGYLDGNNGFTINGNESSAYSVSRAGDVNGDGIDDFLIGNPSLQNPVSHSYVVFGKH